MGGDYLGFRTSTMVSEHLLQQQIILEGDEQGVTALFLSNDVGGNHLLLCDALLDKNFPNFLVCHTSYEGNMSGISLQT